MLYVELLEFLYELVNSTTRVERTGSIRIDLSLAPRRVSVSLERWKRVGKQRREAGGVVPVDVGTVVGGVVLVDVGTVAGGSVVVGAGTVGAVDSPPVG